MFEYRNFSNISIIATNQQIFITQPPNRPYAWLPLLRRGLPSHGSPKLGSERSWAMSVVGQ